MAHPLVRLADGTVLQTGPLTGTQVWTIPGRSHRPLDPGEVDAAPVAPGSAEGMCSFCSTRYRETTPEKARLVAEGGKVRIDRRRLSGAMFDDVAQFRRFANLFEIVSTASWRINHGFIPQRDVVEWAQSFLAEPQGQEQIRRLLDFRAERGGPVAPIDADGLEAATVDLLAGAHDVVVARRHLIDGATSTDQLAGSGTLAPQEHRNFMDFTVDGLAELYRRQPAARYVSVFQNWLRPAGASIDHLHKQLVAIDSYGPQLQREALALREDRRLYQHAIVDLAAKEQLVIAANDYAVAVAGIGHRFPAIEIYSRSRTHLPWEHSPEEAAGMSDLLHAMHAATGAQVPTNEEWHYRPPEISAPMPWRIVLKWRIQVPAGFEGGTKIYVNTVDPWTVRERTITRLKELDKAGEVAPGLRVGAAVRDDDLLLGYAS